MTVKLGRLRLNIFFVSQIKLSRATQEFVPLNKVFVVTERPRRVMGRDCRSKELIFGSWCMVRYGE